MPNIRTIAREDSKSLLNGIGLQFFAEPAVADSSSATPAGDTPDSTVDSGTAPAADAAVPETEVPDTESLKAEISRLKAESDKRKAALDKATKEAADFKRQLRSNQSDEERRKAELEEATANMKEELETLRKQATVAELSKRVMSVVGDEATSTTIADALYGASDVDTAIDAFNKAWLLREKKLRLEYSKIPAPGASDKEEDPQAQNIELARQLGKSRAESLKGVDNGLGKWAVRH